ncbi:MAG: hypothetical protein FWG87_04380 [Defluviitaleaceae bacterium]|nr:hypothetical protein [Defluviitaleaceae bacterium]
MDFSMSAVAKKQIIVIIAASAVFSLCGYLLFSAFAGDTQSALFSSLMGVNSHANAADTLPFTIGIFIAMLLNIIKVLMLKRMVANAVERDEQSAKNYLKVQSLSRFTITAVVLVITAWLHSSVTNEAGNPLVVNFMGVFFGIFTLPIAAHSMRFFLRGHLKEKQEI